jgi:hypothetical protein
MKDLTLGVITAVFLATMLFASSSAYVVTDPLTGENNTYDGSCITSWECQNGVAVKADYIPPALQQNPESAKQIGYHTVDGSLCYADPKAKPDCSSAGGGAVVSNTTEQPSAPTEVQEPVKETPKKRGFIAWLKRLFGR